MPREIRDIKFNAGYDTCQARMSILSNETVHKDLDYIEIGNDDVDLNSYVYVNQNGVPAKMKLADVIASNAMQSDWLQDDPDKLDYIKNKPPVELEEDLVSLYNLGGIKMGQIFKKGTPYIEIVKELLMTTTPETFRFGVVDDLANFRLEDVEEFEISTATLIADGWQHQLTFNNQYLALLIPENSHVDVRRVYQAGYALDLEEVKGYSVLDENDKVWKLYTNAEMAPITGTFMFVFKFKFTGQE